MFQNMTIAKKLFSSMGAALVVALLMGITTVISITQMNFSVDQVVHADARRQVLGDAINVNVSQLISILRAQLVRASVKDQTYADKYYRDYQKEVDDLNRNVAELAPLVETPAGEAYVAAMRTGSPRMAELNERIHEKEIKGDINGSIALFMSEFAPLSNQMRAQSEQFAALQTALMAGSAQKVKAEETRALWLTGGMFLGCAVLAGIVIMIVRRINQDLRLTTASLNAGAEQIAAVAAQTAETSQSLARGATSQAASIEETSAAAEEINSMARQNVDNSHAVVEIFRENAGDMVQADQDLEAMVAAMNEITESSGKIAKIIKVIDEIAFQTNILALNAAVEAARAGENGKGFAVVADEVRNLAQRNAQAAKDTTTLIEESIGKASSGKSKVDQVATIMQRITANGERMTLLIDGIHQGSAEQSRGIAQIGQAITEIEKSTQTTAANSEESAATAEELSAQAETLKESIARLRTMVGAEAGSEMERASSPRRSEGRRFRLAPTQSYARPAVKNALLGHAGVGSLKSATSNRGVMGGSFEESFQEF